MPFYWLTTISDGGDPTVLPFVASNDEQAVRDAIAYVDGLRAKAFNGIASFTVEALVIGGFNPATGEIESYHDHSLFNSDKPDESITLPELPTIDLLAKVGGADGFGPTRPYADAVSLGLAHGQRPDERGLVAAHAVTADSFEEFEAEKRDRLSASRWQRKGAD
jgi:hypothetical protein